MKTNFAILTFVFAKISKQLINWILIIFMFFSLFLLNIYFGLGFDKSTSFYLKFNYFVLILNFFLIPIFLIINILNIFSYEFDDGTWLLLIAKPCSRLKLFIWKLISLHLFSFLIIALIWLINSSLMFLLTNTDLLKKKNLNLWDKYKEIIINHAIFTSILIVVVILNISLLTLILKTQTVFIISILCSSMFLLGGLPYSLFFEISDNNYLTFSKFINAEKKQEIKHKIKEIKSALTFKNDVFERTNKYPHVSSFFFNFFNENINEKDWENKLIKKLNLETNLYKKNNTFNIFNFRISKFKKNRDFSTILDETSIKSKMWSIDLKVEKNIKLFNEIDSNDPFEKELQLIFVQEYDNNKENIIKNYLDPGTKLFLIKTDKELKFSYEDNQDAIIIDSENFSKNLKNKSIIFDENTQEKFDNVFQNPFLLLLQSIVEKIQNKVRLIKELENSKLIINKVWLDYEKIMSVYCITSYFNIFEHWNQIWTKLSEISEIKNRWFEQYLESSYDLKINRNYLNSYQDFMLYEKYENDQIKLDLEVKYFFKDNQLLIIYATITAFSFLLSLIIVTRKKFS
jgi:ABC-type transport system involved in multi-copper enzyme maturation permease subunit